MNTNRETFRDRLLAELPPPAGIAGYKQHVEALLRKNEKRIRRERIAVMSFWIFCAVAAALYMWFDPKSAGTPKGPFLACFMFLWGMVELLKHYVNSLRIDLLKEVKQVQIQVLELHELTLNQRTN